MLAQMSNERGRRFPLGARKVHRCFLANDLKVVLSFPGYSQISNVLWELANTLKCSICALQIKKVLQFYFIFPD